MSKSTSPLPDFKPEDYRKLLEARREAKARLLAIASELEKFPQEEEIHSRASSEIRKDILSLYEPQVFDLETYRDLLSLYNDTYQIREKIKAEEKKLEAECKEVKQFLENAQEAIQNIKKAHQKVLKKVIDFEKYRSKRKDR